MKRFSFNFATHNYWEIYEKIKYYYPIGIENELLQAKYPGRQELGALINERFHNPENFRSWLDFIDGLGKKYPEKEFLNTTMGQVPSYSGKIELQKIECQTYRIIQQIHFSISYLGNYFTIYGEDLAQTIDDKNLIYESICKYVVSPVGFYSKAFECLENEISQNFPGYRLIPFNILNMEINGLQYDMENISIFNALFNLNSNLKNNIPIQGNAGYGSHYWEKSDFDKNYVNN